jgi:hypothetical protein
MNSAKIAGDSGYSEQPPQKRDQGAWVTLRVCFIQGLNKFDILPKSNPEKKTFCLIVNGHQICLSHYIIQPQIIKVVFYGYKEDYQWKHPDPGDKTARNI